MPFIFFGDTLRGSVEECGGQFQARDPGNTLLGTFRAKTEAVAALPFPDSTSDRERMLGQPDRKPRSDKGKARRPSGRKPSGLPGRRIF